MPKEVEVEQSCPAITNTDEESDNESMNGDDLMETEDSFHEGQSFLREYLKEVFGVAFSQHAFCGDTLLNSMTTAVRKAKLTSASKTCQQVFKDLCPNDQEELKRNFCGQNEAEKHTVAIESLMDDVKEELSFAQTRRERLYILSHVAFLPYSEVNRYIKVPFRLYQRAKSLRMRTKVVETRKQSRFNMEDLQTFVNFITR